MSAVARSGWPISSGAARSCCSSTAATGARTATPSSPAMRFATGSSKLGARVLASVDGAPDGTAIKTKLRFPFPVLSDPGHAAIDRYGGSRRDSGGGSRSASRRPTCSTATAGSAGHMSARTSPTGPFQSLTDRVPFSQAVKYTVGGTLFVPTTGNELQILGQGRGHLTLRRARVGTRLVRKASTILTRITAQTGPFGWLG